MARKSIVKPAARIFFDALEEDDLERVKMGRFSDADEKMMESLVRGRGSLFYSLGRYKVDFRQPGLWSTRPRSLKGGQTFTFSHRTIAKRTSRPVPAGRVYIRSRPGGQPMNFRQAGARYDRKVHCDGKRGGWWIGPSATLPDGSVFASDIQPLPTGRGLSTAAGAQQYIEREGAVETVDGEDTSIGNIAPTLDARMNFWTAVVERERSDGRVQSRIVAELPFEQAVGAAGRRRILQALGDEFTAMGLPFHGVVHVPDEHSDRRNFHLHFYYHDRPARFDTTDRAWIFSSHKSLLTRARDYIPGLRKRFAGIVNRELARAGLRYNYDHRTYRDMGVAKLPGEHMGSAVAGLERRGIITPAGRRNYHREWLYRFVVSAGELSAGLLADKEKLEKILTRVKGMGAYQHVNSAVDEVARATDKLLVSSARVRQVRALSTVRAWRFDDLSRRPAGVIKNGEVGSPAVETAKIIITGLKREKKRHANNRGSPRQDRLAERRHRASFIDRVATLEAELLLAERQRAVVATRRARAGFADHRVSEKEWRDRGEQLTATRAALADRVVRCELQVKRIIEDSCDKKEAALLLALAAGGARYRRQFIERLPDNLVEHFPAGKSGVSRLVDEIVDLKRRQGEIDGETRRRRRREKIDKTRQVRASGDQMRLETELERAVGHLETIDFTIRDNPVALRLAVARGLEAKLARPSGARRIKAGPST